MYRTIKKLKQKVTLSELRGIFLVILGVTALGYYYSWWFVEGRLHSPWLVLGFIAAILYGGIQILGNWIIYLATHHRPTNLTMPIEDLTVDVFVTACGEEYALIERALTAACAMHGDHRTWLLDDGDDPELARLAANLGAGYLTRSEHRHAKAGNVNAALARTDGDIVVIFDIDHAPKPDFLQKTLGYFADPEVGFVQVMLTFENEEDGWVARAAAESSLDFYNPTSIGADGIRSATLVGSNALIRRRALDSIGGYHPGLAEDLATSIALHAAGWRSVYVNEPLAPGYAPPDLAAWFTQQLKWARGVFELLLTAYPRYFPKLNPGQRLSYAVRMTYYWIGPFVCTHLLLVLAALWHRSSESLAEYQDYLLHLLPLMAITLLIRQLALRRWCHPSLGSSLQWKPVALVYATWPVYTLAWVMAVLRVPLSFRPTPKTAAGSLNLSWLLPQTLTTLLLFAGLSYVLFTGITQSYGIILVFATALAMPQLLLFNPRWLAAGNRPVNKFHLPDGERNQQLPKMERTAVGKREQPKKCLLPPKTIESVSSESVNTASLYPSSKFSGRYHV